MLVAVSKTAVKLVGDQPCIVPMGYTHAVVLMGELDRPIEKNMNNIDRFLVRVFYKIDREVQLAFHTIYKQVCKAQTSAFSIKESIITTLYSEIDAIFNQIVRN